MIKQKVTELSKLTRKTLSELTWNSEELEALKSLGQELSTQKTMDSIKLDPYWPKWDSPWWKALLLSESGMAELIPQSFVEQMLLSINQHYLHHFPFVGSEIPAGYEPYRHVLCHCALGNMSRLLEQCGCEVDKQLLWFNDWCSRYQLPDGGFNCDEAAYTNSRKSSFLSTLPMLEAMLMVYKRTGNEELKAGLEVGAEYLLNHAVYKSSSWQLITDIWLRVSFPRYYDYDVLRGLSFLVEWAVISGRQIPTELVMDCLQQMEPAVDENGLVRITEDKISIEGSLVLKGGVWEWEKQSTGFPALLMFGKVGSVSLPLSRQWLAMLEGLQRVID
jgi:hypothetical protein